MSHQRTTVYKRYRIFRVNFPTASIASARPRPIFSTLLLRTMSLGCSVTRRTKSVRLTGSLSGSSPVSHIAARGRNYYIMFYNPKPTSKARLSPIEHQAEIGAARCTRGGGDRAAQQHLALAARRQRLLDIVNGAAVDPGGAGAADARAAAEDRRQPDSIGAGN